MMRIMIINVITFMIKIMIRNKNHDKNQHKNHENQFDDIQETSATHPAPDRRAEVSDLFNQFNLTNLVIEI